MKAIALSLVFVLLAGCTSQWSAITTKSAEDLEKYRHGTASDFIYRRYITKTETAGLGYLYKGMDLVASGAEALQVSSDAPATYYEISRKYNLYDAHYNLADYSQLIKPKMELSNLCTVHGGSLASVKLYRVNIPKTNLDAQFGTHYLALADQYFEADSIANDVNELGLGVPLLATAEDVRRLTLESIGQLHSYEQLRQASSIDTMLSGDAAAAGEDAFGKAIAFDAFGVFECLNSDRALWRASIIPLWNEVRQSTQTNRVVMQIAASD